MAKRIAVKDLRAGSIEATPIDKDWSTGLDFEGYGDGEHGWQYWEAQECETCGKVIVSQSGTYNGEKHSDIDPESECDGYIPEASGPMMNYWYPAEIKDPEEAARLIADLPLCVVQVDGEYGLALTGGGMDLSWEICEAYTRIGQLPPTHFRLPRMASRGDSAQDKYILAACRASIRVQMRWLQNNMSDLRAMSVKATAK